MAGFDVVGFNGNCQGFFGAKEDDKLFPTGDSGVKEVTEKELKVGGMDRDDHAGTF